jgi:hypothetical protein
LVLGRLKRHPLLPIYQLLGTRTLRGLSPKGALARRHLVPRTVAEVALGHRPAAAFIRAFSFKKGTRIKAR